MNPTAPKIWTLVEAQASFQNTIMATLGLVIETCNDEVLQLSMPISTITLQPFGLLHGGVTMLLVESAASFHACWGVDLNEKYPVGIEINGSHLNSASSGHVRAVAKVLRRSRSLIVHEVEVVHAESKRKLCVGRVTNFYKTIKRE
ncbi:MAG: PaaI family thioesterase [Candidatus Nitrotoga sp.]